MGIERRNFWFSLLTVLRLSLSVPMGSCCSDVSALEKRNVKVTYRDEHATHLTVLVNGRVKRVSLASGHARGVFSQLQRTNGRRRRSKNFYEVFRATGDSETLTSFDFVS